MEQVHKDVMQAFERKVKSSIDDWFNIPHSQGQPSGHNWPSPFFQPKPQEPDAGTGSDSDTDSASWKQISNVADVPKGTVSITATSTRNFETYTPPSRTEETTSASPSTTRNLDTYIPLSRIPETYPEEEATSTSPPSTRAQRHPAYTPVKHAPEPTALHRRGSSYDGDYDPSPSPSDSEWEKETLNGIHRDVMNAFSEKNRAELWRQNHPGEPLPGYLGRPSSRKGYELLKGMLHVEAQIEAETDAESEEQMEDKRRDSQHAGPKTTTRRRRARRAATPTPPKRTLKALLQDFDTCVRDSDCDVETTDFLAGLDVGNDETEVDSREQLLSWCRGFCERDPRTCRAIGCDRYLVQFGTYED
ncbi:hypothetical protein K491DRAFT_691733, partial [Lophiostoma macrostomum CBS 122681]